MNNINIKCYETGCYWNIGDGECASRVIYLEDNQSVYVKCQQFITKPEAERRLKLKHIATPCKMSGG